MTILAVRREKVILELDDAGFSTSMARNAAATALLERALKSLDGTNVTIHERISKSTRELDRLSVSAVKADSSINQLTGRLRLFADAAAVLGPALAPLGGVAIAGVAGLSAQMGFAAVGAGVLMGSMQGLGDALAKLNKADLEPTAENIAKAEDALNRLSPAAARFAQEMNDLGPILRTIRDMGAEQLFPGLSASMDNFEALAPRIGAIFAAVGDTFGQIADDASTSLSGPRWAEFISFIEDEAPKALSEMATTLGDVTHGLAEMWMAFTPLNNDFSSWLMDAADSFDEWASGLDQTEGFQEFVDYIRTTGPQVADTLAAIGDMFLQIIQAAAPLGGPTLAALEAVAKAAAAIADSGLGTPLLAAASAMALLSRATSTYAIVSKTAFGGAAVASLKGMGAAMDTTTLATRRATTSVGAFGAANKAALVTAGKSAALLGGLAVASTGAADGFGLTNTASLALMGTIAGPWGAAIGGGVGLLLDFKAAEAEAATQTDTYAASLREMTQAQLEALLMEEHLKILEEGAGSDTAKFDAIKKQITATKELSDAKIAQATADRRAALAFADRAGLQLSVANSAELSVKKIEEMTKALQESREAGREAGRATAASFGLLGESLNKAKVSLSDWIAEQEEAARALSRFNDNSIKAASRGLNEDLIASLREAGEEGALRMNQLANGAQSGIGRANESWKSMQREIKRTERVTLDLIGLSPAKIRAEAETAKAISDINALENRLRAIKDESVNVVVRQIGSTTLGPRNEAADGGTVPKTGKPYADRHLYLLADGEEVISNRRGQADKHRSLLKSINGGLAEGGTAGGEDEKKRRKITRTGSEFVVDNTRALEKAIERLTMVSVDQADIAEGQTAALEYQTSKLDDWSSKMADVAQSTIAGLKVGIFDESSNPWSAGASSGALGNVNSEIASLNERASIQSQLSGMGISGDTLAALLDEGSNADLQSLIASGTAGSTAAAITQRDALRASVGAAGGRAAYGQNYEAQARVVADSARASSQAAASAAQAAQNVARMENKLTVMTAALDRMERTAPERTGAAVGAAVNSAAADGQRDRNNRGGRG